MSKQTRIPPSLKQKNHTVIEVIRACDVKPEQIAWCWKGWLAAGKFHVLAGAPGTGKTTIAISLAATITSGGFWPDGTPSKIGNVVIWSGEDDPKDTLIPRLTQAKADLSRVHFIIGIKTGKERRSFDPAIDMEPLRQLLKEIGEVHLLIINPIVSAISGDSHKNAEVRRSLQPLIDLTASMRCALLGITHFSKGTSGRDPVERLTGSLAFGTLARIVLVVSKQQKQGDDCHTTRIFLRAKSNIGPDDGGFEYALQQEELKDNPGIITSSIVWSRSIEGSAHELLTRAEKIYSSIRQGAKEEAMCFLSELLINGPLSATDIEEQYISAGYSEATIRRAKSALKINVHKEGGNFGNNGQQWIWQLPTESTACSGSE
ncbi:MAG: AAA family ATPase [Legionella sp.]|nr:AAA family ATPase [Legionella sp.]